jgi:hypothetical protein
MKKLQKLKMPFNSHIIGKFPQPRALPCIYECYMNSCGYILPSNDYDENNMFKQSL